MDSNFRFRPTVPVSRAYNPGYAHVQNEHVWQTKAVVFRRTHPNRSRRATALWGLAVSRRFGHPLQGGDDAGKQATATVT
jgi:hypothetical protein